MRCRAPRAVCRPCSACATARSGCGPVSRGSTMTASVTNEGVEALDLKVGVPATAVFKAYSVMVAAQP